MPNKAGKITPIVWKRDYQTDVAGEALMHWTVVDRGKGQHDVMLPPHLIHHPTELRKKLADYMADLPTNGASALAMIDAAIKTGPQEAGIGTLTGRTGWHLASHPPTFVFRGRTVGDPNVVHRGLVGLGGLYKSEKGEIRGWRKGLKKPCRSSPYLVFALSLAFAGPTLRFYRVEPAYYSILRESRAPVKPPY